MRGGRRQHPFAGNPQPDNQLMTNRTDTCLKTFHEIYPYSNATRGNIAVDIRILEHAT
jgi:hypothetical protein